MTDRWRSTRTERPDRPMMVMFYRAAAVFTDVHGDAVTVPSLEQPYRDERYGFGFWDGEQFCDIGTGHESFEPEWMYDAPQNCPTHWAPVLPPPLDALRKGSE